MRHALTRILILGWALAWFGLIAPGHQRGQVVLPGGEAEAACSAGGCCAADVPSPDSDGDSGSDPTRHCAVCFLVANLDAPPTPMFGPVAVDRPIDTVRWHASVCDAVATPANHRSRAPPVLG